MNVTVKELQNIQWLFNDEYDDSVLQGINSNKIFERLKKVDKLPIVSGDIYFSSDIWDFSTVVHKTVPRRKSTFTFKDVNEEFKEAVKFFTLVQIWQDRNKIQSIYSLVYQVRHFLSYLVSNDIYSLEYVSLQTVKRYIDNLENFTASTIQKHKYAISDFFQFYTNNIKKIDWFDIHKYLHSYDSKAILAQRKANKWDTIPEDYFNRLITCLNRIMNDETEAIDDRGISAMIILLSQTGLRNGEICDCKIDCIGSLKILDGTKTAYYLRYTTKKNTKGNGSEREVYTVMTDLARQAYTILTKIYEKRRVSIGSNLLFVPLKARTLPVTENTLDRMLTAILLKHGKEIGCINVTDKYPTLKTQNVGILTDRHVLSVDYLNQYERSDVISIPRPHQFRVHLCNQLFQQGVSLLFIKKHMGHLEREMTVSYFRQKEDLDKEKEYAESVMRLIVTGESQVIGEAKDTLMKIIDEFIQNSKLNVATNLDEIIKGLTKKIPIRAKNGGICIKSGPIRDCSKSDPTDDLFCAYGMCINFFHTFYMIDINYNKYTTLLKTIKYNEEKGFRKAAEKETSKLKWIIENFLIPELDDLRKEMMTKGEVSIKQKYPQITFFVDNFDSIYEEISSWIK
ncbi:site-specific integrase [Cohnella lubricantis]|uniref:Site-specific integrase n=1 Tax=Cohnella lubricantis TaxID=2163172 RepID=A0A841T743_9BACL|nr:site-specific integrase [Cohnella lubricantis]MBB6677353.1 site-specific integrase [Cohnella lubricantis]MBP2120600.1 site-specific recombinase XerD [Cohnella lubricantis]